VLEDMAPSVAGITRVAGPSAHSIDIIDKSFEDL
jgi:hypothetical protein